jgi:aryl-alcohol dehydrogenase-like predicted oxidoreductase
MEHRTLGSTRLDVPVVGMGTWQTFDVRGRAEETARADVVRAAIDAGTTLFDTSPMYGESERVLADALHASGVARDDVLVADKVWTSDPTEARRQIDDAMRRYDGLIDIYQIHNLVAWREHLTVLERLRDGGSVRIVGATHYAHSAFDELLRVMRTGRIGQIQIPYNVADRAVERTILPAAADLGIGVLVMRPLGEGKLVKHTPSPTELAPLAAFGVRTWAQALLKWVLTDERVHGVLPATRRCERARENAAAGDPPWLDSDARAYVERLAVRRG